MSTRESLESEDYFENLTFSGLDLQGLDLSRREFFRCTFRGSKLQETRWAKTRLEQCAFEDCDLTGMKPQQLLAVEVVFRGSKLMGIDFSDLAPNPRLAFVECNLRYASFTGVNLRKTQFERCRATEVNFLDLDLVEAEFTGCDLTASTFRGCDLRRADFAQARGLFFEPSANRVREARIPLDTAVAIATSLGLRVEGFADER